MILTTEQAKILFRCIGGGPVDKSKILIFGNELGTAEGGGNTETTVKKFVSDWSSHPVLTVGAGFVPQHMGTLPVNSVFLQCISRLALAIRYKEDRFFDSLSGEVKGLLNKYILEELYRTETAVINLKPLPQSTERHWDYQNVDESRYHKMFNFTLCHPKYNPWQEFRMSILKEAFDINEDSLILAAGDRFNKKAFFQTIYPEIEFETVTLKNNIQLFVSKNPRIIISKYYSPYTGLGLDGLKILYRYLADSKLV